MDIHTEAARGEYLSKRNTKFWSLVGFSWKKIAKRISGRNSSATISEKVNKKPPFEGEPYPTHSDSFPKRFNITSHEGGRSKGHTDRQGCRRHFENHKRNEEIHHIIRNNVENIEDHLQEDSNAALSKWGLKRPKLSDVHNPNFRLRLYHELNVVRKPRICIFKSIGSRSKPITMNKEQTLDRRSIDKECKVLIHTGGIRQSMVYSDDEEIFALDI